MGGSELANNYTLKLKTPYKLITQLHNPKQSSLSEQTIINSWQNATSITFKGNLEIPATWINEYDK